MSESTTTDREPLDLDAWIDSAELGEADVTLAAAGKSLAVLRDLRRRRARDLAKRTIAPGRMVAADHSHELDGEIAELQAEVRRSERTFRFRGIDGDTHKACVAEHKASGEAAVVEAVVAAASIEPKMTTAQVHKLRQRVGEGQFKLVVDTVNEISFEVPDLDF